MLRNNHGFEKFRKNVLYDTSVQSWGISSQVIAVPECRNTQLQEGPAFKV